MLPHEDKTRARISKELNGQLEYSRRTLREYLEVINPPIHFNKVLPRIVSDMVLGLHVRIARKYRQVILLAEIGQADGAEVLCRSMFEAVLTLAFICRQSVRLRRASGGTVNLHGKKLTQRFRATLFFAHDAMQEEKRLEHMSRLPGFKRVAKQSLKQAAIDLAALKTELGPAWSTLLARSNTCSGLAVSDFAYTFGRSIYKWYRTIYALHSSHVHPGDYQRFVVRDPRHATPFVRFDDSSEEVARVLLYSAAIVELGAGEFARLLDRAHKPYIDARLFQSTYPELKAVFLDLYDEAHRS